MKSIIEDVQKEVKKTKPKKKAVKKEPAKKAPAKKAPAKKPITKTTATKMVKAAAKAAGEPVEEVKSVPATQEPETPSNDLFTQFMKDLDTEGMGLTKKDITTLQSGVSNIQNTNGCIVRNCCSEECKQKAICPFSRIDKYPDGQPCPVEKAISDVASNEYFKMIEEEIGHSEFNIVEISAVQSIIEIELDEFRTRVIVNDEGVQVRTPLFSIKETGQVIYGNIEHPLYNLRDRLDRRKSKLIQRLLLSPEAKARFKIEDKGRNSKKTIDLITSAEEKIRELKLETTSGKRSDVSE